MLTAKQIPFTGPLYGPSHSQGPNKALTAKALKRAMIRMGWFDGKLADIDEHYNAKLEAAIRQFQRSTPDVQRSGQYGRGTWEAIRAAKVPQSRPNAGQYALDGLARKLILEDAKPPPDPLASFRDALADFCEVAEANEGLWHYDQQRPYSGLGIAPDRPHVNDCSSYVCLAYYWAREKTGLQVIDPSGYSYKGWGNTWDNLDGHPKVSGSYLVSDLAHYDGHVTICRKAGDAHSAVWSGFGREAGPLRTGLFYRSDLLFVCRPPLLA